MEAVGRLERISEKTLTRVMQLNGITSEDKDAFTEMAKVSVI